MTLARRICLLAGRLMPPRRRVWGEAMQAEGETLSGPAALAWSMGCLKAACVERLDMMEESKPLILVQRVFVLFCIAFGLYWLSFTVKGWLHPVRLPEVMLEMRRLHPPPLRSQIFSFASQLSFWLMPVCGVLCLIPQAPRQVRFIARLVLAATIAALIWFNFWDMLYGLFHYPFHIRTAYELASSLVVLLCAATLALGMKRLFWPLLLVSTAILAITMATTPLLSFGPNGPPIPLMLALTIHLSFVGQAVLLIWLGAGLLQRQTREPAIAA